MPYSLEEQTRNNNIVRNAQTRRYFEGVCPSQGCEFQGG